MKTDPSHMQSSPIEILVADDSEQDIRLIREALAGSTIRKRMHTVSDGEQAMAFLRKEGKYTTVPRPGLLVLDLNMPCKDGRQVLKEIKEDQNLRHIPVIILTTSDAETDIQSCYDLHANCFLTKPIDFVQFERVIQSIESFWLDLVTLPPKCDRT